MAEAELHLTVTDLKGAAHRISGPVGWKLMEIIRDAGLPIAAECGGCCACATCHVYVDEAWFAKLPPASEDELSLIGGEFDTQPTSRLSCQIVMNAELEGLSVTLAPATQP